jgi:hypothetical protein
MYWYNLKSDTLKNMEIQLPLDVYQEETPDPMELSFSKNKSRKYISTNTNDYQSKLIENTENFKDNKENIIKSINKSENKTSVQTTLLDYGFKLSKTNIGDYISKLDDKKDLLKKGLYSIFGIDVVDKKENNKVLIEPTGLVSYVNPKCTCGGSEKVIKYGTDDRKLVKKDGTKETYEVQGYMCKSCSKTFFASLNTHIDS